MKWKEFKNEVEKQGVKDDMEMDYIDTSGIFDLTVTIEKNTFSVY